MHTRVARLSVVAYSTSKATPSRSRHEGAITSRHEPSRAVTSRHEPSRAVTSRHEPSRAILATYTVAESPISSIPTVFAVRIGISTLSVLGLVRGRGLAHYLLLYTPQYTVERPKDTLRAARYARGRPLMVLYAACRSKATRKYAHMRAKKAGGQWVLRTLPVYHR